MSKWVYDEMMDSFILCEGVEDEEIYQHPKHQSVNQIPCHYRLDGKSGKKYYDYDVPKQFTYETRDNISLEWRRMLESARPKKRLERSSFESDEAFQTYNYYWLGFHSMKCVNYWYPKKAKYLELAVKELLEKLDFEVSWTGNPNDGGIDLSASKGNFKVLFQCKGLGKKLGVGPVREAIGIKNDYMTNFAIVCPIGFSGYAKHLAKENNIVLLDAHSLIVLARGNLESLQTANIVSLHR